MIIMEIINLSISIISTILYLINIISVFIFAFIIINRLYISKKYNKRDNFDLYNDLFSWETFFFSIAIVNILNIILLFLPVNNIISYLIFKIVIIIMFSGLFMKIFHVEKIMKIITYERHYYLGIVLFPIILILLIFNIQPIVLILIFIIGSLIPFLIFYSFLRNREISVKNSIKICMGVVLIALGGIFSVEYVNKFIISDESINILYNIINITTPILFILGSLLIYNSYRIYL